MMFSRQYLDQINLRYFGGISLIFWTCFLLFINIILIVIPNIRNTNRRCKLRWAKRKALAQKLINRKAGKKDKKLAESNANVTA
jgi:hypothetical protein